MSPDEEDSAETEEGGVLSPDELDITDDENVVEIEEGRYVISSGGGPPSVSGGGGPGGGRAASDRGASTTPETDETASESDDERSGELTETDVHDWLERDLQTANSKYGFDVTAKFEGSVSQRQLFSNDVSTTFENLLVWYAQHVGGDTPVEDVLGILLMETNVSIRYPPETIRALVAAQGLSPDDSIADLLETISENDRVPFPP